MSPNKEIPAVLILSSSYLPELLRRLDLDPEGLSVGRQAGIF
jgi:hypothetical protein